MADLDAPLTKVDVPPVCVDIRIEIRGEVVVDKCFYSYNSGAALEALRSAIRKLEARRE